MGRLGRDKGAFVYVRTFRAELPADYSGHIKMRVALGPGELAPGEGGWLAVETLDVEAGQLQEIAENARLYFGDAPRPRG
jgi:hypothetical protein